MVKFLDSLKTRYRVYNYYKHEVENMPLQVASYINYLRTGPRMHSWRAVAEEVCNAFQDYADLDLSGNQLYGEELCKIAAMKLGIIKLGFFKSTYTKDWTRWE